MPIKQPYPHIYRHGPPSVCEPYHELRRTPLMANFGASYRLLKDDLARIFEFVEPVEANFSAFSHRIYELLLRACTEVEALCKLVFYQNGIDLRHRKASMIRYSDLESAMRLSEYEVVCTVLRAGPFVPFIAFTEEKRSKRSPTWYRAYNAVKHNRASEFREASLFSLIQSVGAVYVLLVAQVGFSVDQLLRLDPSGCGFQAVPSLFDITKSPNWPEEERYEFSWDRLKAASNQFQLHPLPERP